ncbi:FAD-dependent monooxygenase [Streptomyces sp. NPDC091292]|uniref:FAD-dependent monooxygenase n=1 Tax=Streptomyces sp. NPDC091292 TaxID=3365991 RepID=UPI00382C8100
MSRQVVIAGAGPVGLWLAAELRLAGTTVTVIEPRSAPDPQSKALTVHPRTVEILVSRGVDGPFLAEALRIPSGHFAVLPSRLDFRRLDTRHPYTLSLIQARTEELLEELARSRGADVRRGHRVTGLTEREDAVTVHIEGPGGPYTEEALYVVGCDGTRSTVRESAGIDYVGDDFTVLGWLADVVLAEPPADLVFSTTGRDGLLMAVPLPGGLHRIVGGVPHDVRRDWPGELTLEEARANAVTAAGTDFGMHSPAWLSRYGNTSRQAERYRAGRILLAGDAAHQHMPAGGVGLNVGVQDATNLGWKLAATVNGWAPEGLLDTYHAERHPVGADLLESSQAQTALISAFSPEGQALRSFLARLVGELPGLELALAERLSGLYVRYPAPDPDAHPLTGVRAPDLALAGPPGLLSALLHPGRPVLLDLRNTPDGPPLPEVPKEFDLVRTALAEDRPAWAGITAALIRPDGHVAWATGEEDGDRLTAGVRTALASAHRHATA